MAVSSCGGSSDPAYGLPLAIARVAGPRSSRLADRPVELRAPVGEERLLLAPAFRLGEVDLGLQYLLALPGRGDHVAARVEDEASSVVVAAGAVREDDEDLVVQRDARQPAEDEPTVEGAGDRRDDDDRLRAREGQH